MIRNSNKLITLLIMLIVILAVLELLKNSEGSSAATSRKRSNQSTRGICGVVRGPFSIPLWEVAVPLSSKILDYFYV